MKTEIIDIKQGSEEWLALRKTKITATDAPVIMGVSPWKTKLQLYNEKISSDVKPLYINEKMQRGNDLEPIARDLFILQTGIHMQPKVIVKDWAMASLDGISTDESMILEIKCPGERDHAIAASGKVPDHYYPQIQHQMYVVNVQLACYFSFDGINGISIKVERDEKYIEKMLEEEKKFYDCLINRIPPESSENDYVEREDTLWTTYANHWKEVTQKIKELEMQEQELRNEIISLSGQSNSKGAGISLCQIQRKGNVDYAKIPELKNVNLELYRKSAINSWRLTAQ